MASATKTYSGDLSTAIVGKISDAIEKYRQTKEIERSKASPEVKSAASKLLSNDSDGSVSTTKDTDLKSYIARVFGTELDASIIQTEGKVSKLSDQVLSVGESIVNTQKLVINQNELMESKFDEILSIFRSNDRREEERKDRLEAEGTEIGMEKSKEDFGTQKNRGTMSGDLSSASFLSALKVAKFIPWLRKAGIWRKGLTNRLASTGIRKAFKTRTTKKFAKTAGNEWVTRALSNLAKGEIITNATTSGGKKIAKKTAAEIAAEKASKQVTPDLILGLFRQPAIRKALISTLGEEQATKLVLRLSGKAAPFLQTVYGIGEGIVRLSPFVGGSDWKGSLLSLSLIHI